MKIESVALSLPSWEVANEEVIDLIRHHSKPVFQGNLEKALRKIDIILKKTGAEKRFWLNRQKGERPIDHVKIAVENSLKKANLQKQDIDLLIYVGVGRGFVEPGDSYFVAQALGMKNVKCFDMIDACMSWATAMQVVDSLFKVNAYKNAMIINGEFIVNSGALIKNYALKNEQQLEYTFPTYTVGEGATCTILTPEESDNFKFNFSSRTDLSDLCMVPLPEYKDYCDSTSKIAANGEMYFTSFGSIMHELGAVELQKLFKSSLIKRDEIDIVFTHASSKSEWQACADAVGMGDKVYHIYQKTGNLISASVPGAMSLALEEQLLKRGNKVLFWVGSAGMSFSTITFTF